MNRRAFFNAVTAAVIAASAGISLRDDQKKLVAKYRRQYDLYEDRFLHRFEVRADGNAYYVDGMTREEALKEHEITTMLTAIERYIGDNVTVVF